MLSFVSVGYHCYRELAARRRSPGTLAETKSLRAPDRWFHSIDLGQGGTTRGDKPNFILRRMADIAFRGGVAGKSVLDIGSWDGFYAFEAERRGAARVLATDHFSWSGPGWGTKTGFDYAHACLDSRVESLDVDVPSLDQSKLGTFDVVLFLGVLYHLPDPYAGLKQAAAMTHDLLVVETVTTCNFLPIPMMRFYRSRELGDDPTNFWAPNVTCLRRMLRDLGFESVVVAHNGFRHPATVRHFVFASKRNRDRPVDLPYQRT